MIAKSLRFSKVSKYFLLSTKVGDVAKKQELSACRNVHLGEHATLLCYGDNMVAGRCVQVSCYNRCMPANTTLIIGQALGAYSGAAANK